MSLTRTVDSSVVRKWLQSGRLLVILGTGSPTQAHYCLEECVKEFMGHRIDYADLPRNFRGKPFLPDSPMHFSISHTKNEYVLGFSIQQEIGVDMELNFPGKDLHVLAEYAFSPDELLISGANSDESTFLKIWTLKEAYLKATGIGLIDALPTLHVVTGPPLSITDPFFCGILQVGPSGETISIVCKGIIPEKIFLKYLSHGKYQLL
jgi:hypothetical protein